MRVKENKEVYEGEVIELTPEETENPHGGYGKTISSVVVGLRTAKGTKQLRLDPSIYDSIQKEKIRFVFFLFFGFFFFFFCAISGLTSAVGDVIFIEANSGAVKVRGNNQTKKCIVI